MANMYTYIKEQGDVLRDIVEKRKDILEPVVDLFKENHIDGIVAIGSGSSYNSITSSRYFCKNFRD